MKNGVKFQSVGRCFPPQSKKFKRTLHATDAFISGSFALYWYLNQHVGFVELPEKSDLDIYVPCRKNESYRHIQICLNVFDLLLEESGYKRDGNLIHSGYYNLALIQDVQTYTRKKTQRSIQIIFIAQPREDRPVMLHQPLILISVSLWSTVI